MVLLGLLLYLLLFPIFLVDLMGVSIGVWIAVLVGSVGGIVVGLVTEYYTGGSPVEKIAKDGETGSATVLISGLATGMQSVAIPVLNNSFNYFYFKYLCRTLWSWYSCCRYVKYSWNNNGNRCIWSSC